MQIGVEAETYPTAIVPGLAQRTGVPSLALRACMGGHAKPELTAKDRLVT